MAAQTGEDRKLAGAQRALFNCDDEWRESGHAAIRTLARQRTPFTSEDVIRRIGMPIGHPSAIGALFVSAQKKNLIKWTGMLKQAERPSCHAATLKVWIGV